MSYKEFIDKAKPEFEKAFKFFESEVSKLHTRRANPSLIENVQVNIAGSFLSIKQLGAISSPQSNQLLIQPWDVSYIEPIERAIFDSELGLSVAVDKNVIRLNLPLLTEEYRQNLIRSLNDKAEQARRTIRHIREDVWNEIQKEQREKKISEDDKFRGKDELQKVIDDYSEKIKNLVENKKKELT